MNLAAAFSFLASLTLFCLFKLNFPSFFISNEKRIYFSPSPSSSSSISSSSSSISSSSSSISSSSSSSISSSSYLASSVSSSSISSSSISSSSIKKGKITSMWKHSFQYENQTCYLRLGECLGVGCDGAVWSSSGICEDGSIHQFAVKFYKNETDLIDKREETDKEIQRRIISVDPEGASNHLAFTHSRIEIPISLLSTSTGQCKVVNYTKNTLCPGILSSYLWRKPEKLVIGSIMPYAGKPYYQASNTGIIRQNALQIIYGLAKGLSTLQKAGIIHCDIQYAHATVTNALSNTGLTTLTTRLIDFGRMRLCKKKEELKEEQKKDIKEEQKKDIKEERRKLIENLNENIKEQEKEQEQEQDKCSFGYKMQMFQFGSLILDFCRPPNATLLDYGGAAYAFNGGACGWSGATQYDNEVEASELFKKAWKEEIKEHYELGLTSCPENVLLQELVREAYKPILEGTELNWNILLNKLKYAIKKTDF